MKKKSKYYIFFLLIFIISFCIFRFFVYDDADNIMSNRDLNENFVYGVFIDGVRCSYDKNSDIYYFSSTDYIINKIEFSSSSDVKHLIYNVDDNVYEVLVYNDDYYDIISIIINTIPIVDISDIYYFDSFINDNFYRSLDFDDKGDTSDEQSVGVHISNLNFDDKKMDYVSLGSLSVRGASSKIFDKKSYKLTLQKKLGFDNIKDDTVWVLDALYMDSSKIRNMLSSYMWNLINDNQKINNDLHGTFVEVFINDEYRGLYVLKEKVDSSVVNLDDDGLLLKAVSHLRQYHIDSFISAPYNIEDDSVLNFEIKKGTDRIIHEFVSKMLNYYETPKTYSLLSDTYDIDNYINYKIFVALICGEDNVSSNQYYSLNDADSKILITPWDMDLTWGLYWNTYKDLYSEFDMNRDFDYEWMNENITNDMDDETKKLLKKRYFELRENVINIDTISSYIDKYKENIVVSDADKRDSSRWYQYDIQYETDNIKKWSASRIDFLDEYFTNL